MSLRRSVERGMSLEEARSLAVDLGAEVTGKRGTGELVFRHGLLARHLVVKANRRDAPCALISWLRRAQEALAGLKSFLAIVPGPDSPGQCCSSSTPSDHK